MLLAVIAAQSGGPLEVPTFTPYSGIFIGATPINRVYRGNTLIYEQLAVVPTLDAIDDIWPSNIPADSGTYDFPVLRNDVYVGEPTITILSFAGLAAHTVRVDIVNLEPQIEVNTAGASPGTKSIIYQLTASGTPSLNDTATLTINIVAETEPLNAINDSYALEESTGIVLLDVLANDENAVGATITIVSDPDGTGAIPVLDGGVWKIRLDTAVGAGNLPPVVALPLVNQNATVTSAFSYQFAAGSFTDPESGALTYTATLSSGAPLPSWLTFTGATRTFAGTPSAGDVALLTVRVTATDPGSLSVSDDFTLNVVSASVERRRLIVLTDIGGDADDEQSVRRLLLYSNEIQIVGLIAGSAGTPGELDPTPKPELINAIIDDYESVRGNLFNHDSNYPMAATLRATVKAGNEIRTAWGIAANDTPGSDHIIAMVDASTEPTHIAIFGGQVDLLQALDSAENRRGKSAAQFATFLSKIRVYAIADQTPGMSATIRGNWPSLRYVETARTDGQEALFRGMYHNDSTGEGTVQLVENNNLLINNTAWVNANVRNHGALGNNYPNAVTQNTVTTNNTAGVKEGDSPSWLYLLHRGMTDTLQPTWGGWGGRFALRSGASQHYIDDALDNIIWQYGETAPTATTSNATARRKWSVARWRREYQMDFAARMDWCNTGVYANANHHPVAGVDGNITETIVYRTVASGAAVTLSAIGSTNAAGGTTGITYRWFQYREVGTYTGAISLSGATSRDASFTAPSVGASSTIHFILAVTTTAAPQLTRYRRVIVTVTP